MPHQISNLNISKHTKLHSTFQYYNFIEHLANHINLASGWIYVKHDITDEIKKNINMYKLEAITPIKLAVRASSPVIF